jgi:type III secretion protein S
MLDEAVRLTTHSLWLVLALSAPPIIAASIVGFLVAMLQAATQLQEQTLQYTLKFFAIVATLFVTFGLMGAALFAFGEEVFSLIAAAGTSS